MRVFFDNSPFVNNPFNSTDISHVSPNTPAVLSWNRLWPSFTEATAVDVWLCPTNSFPYSCSPIQLNVPTAQGSITWMPPSQDDLIHMAQLQPPPGSKKAELLLPAGVPGAPDMRHGRDTATLFSFVVSPHGMAKQEFSRSVLVGKAPLLVEGVTPASIHDFGRAIIHDKDHNHPPLFMDNVNNAPIFASTLTSTLTSTDTPNNASVSTDALSPATTVGDNPSSVSSQATPTVTDTASKNPSKATDISNTTSSSAKLSVTYILLIVAAIALIIMGTLLAVRRRRSRQKKTLKVHQIKNLPPSATSGDISKVESDLVSQTAFPIHSGVDDSQSDMEETLREPSINQQYFQSESRSNGLQLQSTSMDSLPLNDDQQEHYMNQASSSFPLAESVNVAPLISIYRPIPTVSTHEDDSRFTMRSIDVFDGTQDAFYSPKMSPTHNSLPATTSMLPLSALDDHRASNSVDNSSDNKWSLPMRPSSMLTLLRSKLSLPAEAIRSRQ